MMFSAIPSTISRFVYTAENGRDYGLWSCILNHDILAFFDFYLLDMPQNSILIF